MIGWLYGISTAFCSTMQSCWRSRVTSSVSWRFGQLFVRTNMTIQKKSPLYSYFLWEFISSSLYWSILCHLKNKSMIICVGRYLFVSDDYVKYRHFFGTLPPRTISANALLISPVVIIYETHGSIAFTFRSFTWEKGWSNLTLSIFTPFYYDISLLVAMVR